LLSPWIVRHSPSVARPSSPLAPWILGALLGACTLVVPTLGAAQGRWTVTPSLTLSERYDDNLFGTAHDRHSDFISEITPGLALSYESEAFTLGASAAATGQIYADDSDLDNFGENRNATFSLGYRPTQQLTLKLVGNYAHTNDPAAFVVGNSAPVVAAAASGAPFVPTVEISRREATLYSMLAGVGYRVDPRWLLEGSYAFVFIDEKGATDSQSHTISLGTRYDATRTDQVFVDVKVGYFDADESDTSVALIPGWARQWTPTLRTSIAVGPRVTDSDWGAAVDASVAYAPARDWTAALAYSLGTGLALGEVTPQNVSALIGSLGYQATRDLRFAVGGSWTRTWDLGNDPGQGASNTYGATASVSYQITDWLSATLAYQFSYERPSSGDTILDQQVILGLTLAYPYRF
jgi:hypothetical protein